MAARSTRSRASISATARGCEQLNPLGDLSEKGLAQAHGLMVNYQYDVEDIEKNHEAYAQSRVIVAANGIRKRARAQRELAKA